MNKCVWCEDPAVIFVEDLGWLCEFHNEQQNADAQGLL